LLAVGADGDNSGTLGAGVVRVYDLRGPAPTVPWLVLTNPIAAEYTFFGQALAMSSSRLVVGAPGWGVGSTNGAKVWFYDLRGDAPSVPVAVVNSPEPDLEDGFGHSVAVHDRRVMIGAPFGGGAGPPGRAYLYNFSPALAAQPALTLTNPDPDSSLWFGVAVAVRGSRLIVGSPYDSANDHYSGKVFLYDLTNPVPHVPMLELVKPQPAANDLFGSSVALAGDRLLVGARGDGAIARAPGSAWLFNPDGALPGMPVLELTNPAPSPDDAFGCAVAAFENQVLVGALGASAAAPAAGSAYVYDLAGASPAAPLASLRTRTPSSKDGFGTAVAVSGSRLVITSQPSDAHSPEGNRVHIYSVASAPGGTPEFTLTNPVPGGSGTFGSVLALEESRLVIGEPFARPSVGEMGRVYYYDLARTNPHQPSLVFTNPVHQESIESGYGRAVAISGSRVMIGAPEYEVFGNIVAHVHIHDLNSVIPAIPVWSVASPFPQHTDTFGSAVAISGKRAVVSAPGVTLPDSSFGIVFVYDLDDPDPTRPILNLVSHGLVGSGGFGEQVALDGTLLAVAAPFDYEPGGTGGAVHLYDLASSAPAVPILSLQNPSGRAGEDFGFSVAVSGRRVAVGARQASTVAPSIGIAYVFDLTSGNPRQPIATLTNPAPVLGDNFGSAIAMKDGTVMVGAMFADVVTADRGAAYLYTLGPTLRIAQSGPGLATLSWAPASSTGLVLQYSESLANPQWFNAVSGATNLVMISTTAAARFYRLAEP